MEQGWLSNSGFFSSSWLPTHGVKEVEGSPSILGAEWLSTGFAVCGLTPTNASLRFHFYFLNFKEDHQGIRDRQETEEKQGINLAVRQSQGCPLSQITFLWSKDLKADHKISTFSVCIFTFQRPVKDIPGMA